MYLISIYFDEKTNKRMRNYMKEVAEKSGNTFMIDNNVPPHITISAFETLQEKQIVETLNQVLSGISKGKLKWVTVGVFPTVIFIQPVLNEYLDRISCRLFDSISNVPNTKVSKFYRPFQWIPHVTIAKQLSEKEMLLAFEILQKSFGMFESVVVRIELAKKNPFKVIENWELK